MKSKRAYEFINSRKETPITGQARDIEIAIKAVEIAEEDARTRAVRALVASCPFCDDGRKHCWREARTCDEACVPEFLNHYDNEQ